MKRIAVLIALVALVLGGAAGFALGIFIYPFWFLGQAAHDTLPASSSRLEVGAGNFIHVNSLDPVHWGRGKVSLYEEPVGSSLFLHDDFEVGPGPRFHVYLASRQTISSASDFEASETIDLGRLRAFAGSQIYPIPRGADLERYKSVVIWCKEFGVLISPARLVRRG